MGTSRSSRIQLLFVFRAPTTLKVFPGSGDLFVAVGVQAPTPPTAPEPSACPAVPEGMRLGSG